MVTMVLMMTMMPKIITACHCVQIFANLVNDVAYAFLQKVICPISA